MLRRENEGLRKEITALKDKLAECELKKISDLIHENEGLQQVSTYNTLISLSQFSNKAIKNISFKNNTNI